MLNYGIYYMKQHKTLLIIKPDAVLKKNIGNIISMLEINFSLVSIHTFNFTENIAKEFYIEHKGKPFYLELVNFIISGLVVVIILGGDNNIITNTRMLVGCTDFQKADKDTIRYKFAESLTKNAVHASDSFNSFLREYKLIFNKNYEL